ncbi:hypothetical protein AB0B54_08160 [Microbispora bryophytorum]|uniref:hypothetical protein n=1 Tax=Microbispora bryophytorum TaxID=1460882 RepID=UPI00340E2571
MGGLIKHVTLVERSWTGFILDGPSAMGDATAMTGADWGRLGPMGRPVPDAAR